MSKSTFVSFESQTFMAWSFQITIQFQCYLKLKEWFVENTGKFIPFAPFSQCYNYVENIFLDI